MVTALLGSIALVSKPANQMHGMTVQVSRGVKSNDCGFM